MINETERLGGPYPPPPRPQCQELHMKVVKAFFCGLSGRCSQPPKGSFLDLRKTKETATLLNTCVCVLIRSTVLKYLACYYISAEDIHISADPLLTYTSVHQE